MIGYTYRKHMKKICTFIIESLTHTAISEMNIKNRQYQRTTRHLNGFKLPRCVMRFSEVKVNLKDS